MKRSLISLAMAVGLSTTALAAPRPPPSDENISGESVDLENMNLEPLETERKPLKPYEEKHNVDWVTVKDVLAIPFEGVPKAFPPKKIYTWERILPPRCDVSGLERLVVKDNYTIWTEALVAKAPDCFNWNVPGSCAPHEDVLFGRNLTVACARYNFAKENYRRLEALDMVNQHGAYLKYWEIMREACVGKSVELGIKLPKGSADCIATVERG